MTRHTFRRLIVGLGAALMLTTYASAQTNLPSVPDSVFRAAYDKARAVEQDALNKATTSEERAAVYERVLAGVYRSLKDYHQVPLASFRAEVADSELAKSNESSLSNTASNSLIE